MTEPQDFDTDVLVIGAGACGLIAAIAAHAGGATAAIIEKAARLGGNTALSSGSIPAAGTDLQQEAGVADDPEQFIADLQRTGGRHDAMHLVDVLARRSAELIRFLREDVAARITLVTAYRHVGHSVTRLHAPPSRKGVDLLDDLARSVEYRSIPLALGQPAVALLTDGGAVVGASVADGRGGSYDIRARAVILATNGFGAAADLVAELCPQADGAHYAGSPDSEGEAIRWGRELGAAFGNLGSFQGHGALDAHTGGLMTWTTVERGAVIVNADGRRFMDETIGYSAAAAREIQDRPPFHLIADTHIVDDVASRQPEYAEAVAMGAARPATSIAELAAAIKVPEAALEQTLRDAARAAQGKEDDLLGRRDWGLGALDPATLRYTRVQPALFHTQGGLLVDEAARVLRSDGGPIPGLYAGGGAAVGLSGHSGSANYMSGNGLLTALGLGMIAGKAAAAAAAIHTKKSPYQMAVSR